MDLFIIFIIIATFFVVLTTTKNYIPFVNKEGFKNINKTSKNIVNTYKIDNLPNKKINKINKLENKYYNYKGDCIWNNNCEIKPNNFNFFKYNKHKTTSPNMLSCQVNVDNLLNCKRAQFSRCFVNKTCPCQIRNKIDNDNVIKRCIAPNFTLETKINITKSCNKGY